MSSTPEHGKVITIESYYDGSIASTKREYEVSTFSSRDQILKDVIEALGLVSSGATSKLNLEVCIDKQMRYRLIKRWTV